MCYIVISCDAKMLKVFKDEEKAKSFAVRYANKYMKGVSVLSCLCFEDYFYEARPGVWKSR